MAKRQMDTRSPRGLLLGLLGLAGAGALMILLLFLKPGLPSSPTSTAEATLPPPPENPYTEADFYTEDGFVHCSAAPAKTGIDVSSHQEEIDWAAVAASGVDYAMIRVGYRGYDQGGLHTVSYTHLDVYKRQIQCFTSTSSWTWLGHLVSGLWQPTIALLTLAFALPPVLNTLSCRLL